jgi:hypothetical protein
MMSTLPGRASRRALADTTLKTVGSVGIGRINEALNEVVCNYDEGSGLLTSITIAGPTIFARDRTGHRDSQKVGWQLFVRRIANGSELTKYRTDIQKSTSFDDASPFFFDRTFNVEGEQSLDATFTVISKLIWYKTNGRTIAGWQKHRVDEYTYHIPNADNFYPIEGGCTLQPK